jgi:hypothetical protein
LLSDCTQTRSPQNPIYFHSMIKKTISTMSAEKVSHSPGSTNKACMSFLEQSRSLPLLISTQEF